MAAAKTAWDHISDREPEPEVQEEIVVNTHRAGPELHKGPRDACTMCGRPISNFNSCDGNDCGGEVDGWHLHQRCTRCGFTFITAPIEDIETIKREAVGPEAYQEDEPPEPSAGEPEDRNVPDGTGPPIGGTNNVDNGDGDNSPGLFNPARYLWGLRGILGLGVFLGAVVSFLVLVAARRWYNIWTTDNEILLDIAETIIHKQEQHLVKPKIDKNFKVTERHFGYFSDEGSSAAGFVSLQNLSYDSMRVCSEYVWERSKKLTAKTHRACVVLGPHENNTLRFEWKDLKMARMVDCFGNYSLNVKGPASQVTHNTWENLEEIAPCKEKKLHFLGDKDMPRTLESAP